MKKFGAKKDKAVFKVNVVSVTPWPVAAGAAVEVAWRRGSRRGSARGVGAPVGADGLDVGARFSVPATLYRVREFGEGERGRKLLGRRHTALRFGHKTTKRRSLPPSPNSPSLAHQDPTTGAHDKKWLTLELVRPAAPSSRSTKPVPLARGVVDLAALAARVRAAGGARARTDLPLAPASGDVPPTARLTIEVELEGGGGGDDDDRRRSSSVGGESFAADADAAAVAAALAAAEAALAPSPVRRSVAAPATLSDGDGASSDGELLAAAAAAADAEDHAAAAAPSRHRSTTAQESDAWASLHSSAIASAVASAMASDAGSPQRLRGATDDDANGAGVNPFASADSEPAGDAAAVTWAATSNPFEEYSGAEAVPPPPPPPPLPPLTLHPPTTRHALTPSHELYLDGALPLPGETGFGSLSSGGGAGRPRSGGRPPARDPIGDALEAPPPLDAIDLPPDAHDAAVEAGTVVAAPPTRSRPQSASRFARETSAPTSTAPLLSRALLDETGAAIAANRRFARRAAGALATSSAREGAASPPTPDSPTAGAARARARRWRPGPAFRRPTPAQPTLLSFCTLPPI